MYRLAKYFIVIALVFQAAVGYTFTQGGVSSSSCNTGGSMCDMDECTSELKIICKGTPRRTRQQRSSCQEIFEADPQSESGYYDLHINGQDFRIYCNMDILCNSRGGWTRLAYLNMTDPEESCPPGFRLYQANGVRACGRPVSSGGSCQSVEFPSNGISYSRVCGRVVGYQYYTPDAVDSTIGTGHNNLSSHYVDGVSITRGSPRQHVWTLMDGAYDNANIDNGLYNCPCAEGSQQTPQSFIGSDYFCESGNPNSGIAEVLFTADPLWDGKTCSAREQQCCQASGLPWFNKPLNVSTTDHLELRVCCDQTTGNEDVPVNLYEIYVK